MTLAFFCVICGTKTDGNTTRDEVGGYHDLTCSCCLAGIRFRITLKPSRTLEEADSIFQDTPLTDSQRGKKQFTSPRNK